MELSGTASSNKHGHVQMDLEPVSRGENVCILLLCKRRSGRGFKSLGHHAQMALAEESDVPTVAGMETLLRDHSAAEEL